MRLTVAICTWNRSHLLRQTMERMTAMEVPADVEWELVVVNNNSPDDTDRVIGEFAGRLAVRRVFEAAPGAGNARNAAVRASTGDFIVWTDDDVLVDTRWLATYREAFRRWPETVLFAGSITPWFEGAPPSWLERLLPSIGGVFAILEAREAPILPSDSPLPFNANMAMRTDVHRHFPYDGRLGPRAGNLMRGEETAMIRAVLGSGYQGRWLPKATVRHFIPRERQTLGYLRRYFHDYGRTLALMERAGRRLPGRPLLLLRQAVVHEFLYQIRRWIAPPEAWIADLRAASMAWGSLRTARLE